MSWTADARTEGHQVGLYIGRLCAQMPRRVVMVTAAVAVCLLFSFMRSQLSSSYSVAPQTLADVRPLTTRQCNSSYSLTRVASGGADGVLRYRVALVADLDSNSRDSADSLESESHRWRSVLRYGWLSWNRHKQTAQFSWDVSDFRLQSSLSQEGRGMELSELVLFDGCLVTVDDRTGVLYRLQKATALPWVILPDGDGTKAKPFKGEWMTVRGDTLYVGGWGKEWTTHDGVVLNYDPLYVKRVGCDGSVHHDSWRSNYEALKAAAGVDPPGYLVHEAVVWSSIHQQWFFLPRRVSSEVYNDVDDESRGSNILLRADFYFTNIQRSYIGPQINTHGFSSVKFMPDTGDEWLVALKSVEISATNTTETYITVVSIHGQVALAETRLDGDYKFEGIEFV